MYQRVITFCGWSALAAATVFLTAGPGQAAGRGGAHFGGYHGGFSRGATARGYGGAHYLAGSSRGYRGGYTHYGYRPRYGYGGYSYGSYPYLGHTPYSGYYPYSSGYDPYYDSTSVYSSYPYNADYYGEAAPSYSDAGISSAPPVSEPQTSYVPSTVTSDTNAGQSDNTAHVLVKLPAAAELWFDGSKTTSTGPVREFNSPPLTPGDRYAYEVRARWNENGREVTQTQQVAVAAGGRVNVEFPVTPRAVSQTSITKVR